MDRPDRYCDECGAAGCCGGIAFGAGLRVWLCRTCRDRYWSAFGDVMSCSEKLEKVVTCDSVQRQLHEDGLNVLEATIQPLYTAEEPATQAAHASQWWRRAVAFHQWAFLGDGDHDKAAAQLRLILVEMRPYLSTGAKPLTVVDTVEQSIRNDLLPLMEAGRTAQAELEELRKSNEALLQKRFGNTDK